MRSVLVCERVHSHTHTHTSIFRRRRGARSIQCALPRDAGHGVEVDVVHAPAHGGLPWNSPVDLYVHSMYTIMIAVAHTLINYARTSI